MVQRCHVSYSGDFLRLYHPYRFFYDGPRVLFQVALAMLKINGDALLKAKDDSDLMDIVKKFFQTLDEPVSGMVALPGKQVLDLCVLRS